MSEPSRTTLLLQRIEGGDARAAEELLPLVYDELHGLASRQMGSEPAGHTLQPTALVHEAWLRMRGDLDQGPGTRRRFFGFAGRVMRNVLVDHARARRASKRGGDQQPQALDGTVIAYEDRAVDLVSLDEALARLGERDEQLVRLVELRFFAGLEMKDAAEVLGVSLRSAERAWTTARAWLRDELAEP